MQSKDLVRAHHSCEHNPTDFTPVRRRRQKRSQQERSLAFETARRKTKDIRCDHRSFFMFPMQRHEHTQEWTPNIIGKALTHWMQTLSEFKNALMPLIEHIRKISNGSWFIQLFPHVWDSFETYKSVNHQLEVHFDFIGCWLIKKPIRSNYV